ncbi:MAG: GH116 family glycosyl hydrolase [Bacteroidota bacterium]|nr:GH116 family glycosyl hydrolase [Bacteroidota bacterium]
MKKLAILIFLPFTVYLNAQNIPIKSGWKFKTGDDPAWADPALNDSHWAPIAIGEYWEPQGYDHYDGFAWYRLRIVIPSSIKGSAYFSQSLVFDLGKIDDGDEFYLNGHLVGRNGGANNDIKKTAFSEQRTYQLPANDKRILWDQENVLAIRVWDKELEGGMYGGNYGIRVTALPDFVRIHTSDSVSRSGDDKKIFRKITLKSKAGVFDFAGTLRITVSDPVSKTIVFTQNLPVSFAKDRPFEYCWPIPPAENTSWLFTYVFEERRSKQIITVTERRPFIPRDKKLDKVWTASLFEKGRRKIYQGNELNHIAMPCGGIGAGQIEITGDGILCPTESIFNQIQPPNAGLGFSTGDQYLNPQPSVPKIENGFAVRIKEKGKAAQCWRLDRKDFDSLGFIGEYPIATLDYRKSGAEPPVHISAEVFSPFVPLSLRSSANPVTIQRFTITNSSNKTVEVTIAGCLQNDRFSQIDDHDQNKLMHGPGLTGILLGTDEAANNNPAVSTGKLVPRGNGSPQYGDLCLSVLDDKAYASADCRSAEACFNNLKEGKMKRSGERRMASMKTWGGEIGSNLMLAPGETKTITFLVTWYFPDFYESNFGRTGFAGHLYNNWYNNAFEVASYIAAHFDELYRDTKLFHDTYFDNTLPYWLANRITMPLSTLACGNIEVWENGRMYGYEGIGFCPGSTGHVYNFVVPISKLFPELERSERLMQDLNDSVGFSSSGRINFRGHDGASPDAENAYASDAQCGYVLKLYREHLMSPDRHFLDSVWDKAKRVIGYLLFRDGGGIGLEPNGVLEDLQTFWDPMWYGPNPYNNSLYLAALRAAEEMARIEGEEKLADRYRAIFEKGQTFMSTNMWNGEYFVHLYPNGFSGTETNSGFASPADLEQNAKGFTEAFDKGKPNYFASSSCDAQQLFGQNWANQLGLGYILPAEKCRTAAEHIFLYNWTPDISTVYDFGKPLNRTLAAPGEGAMINGSWPFGKPVNFETPGKMPDFGFEKSFENTWDKSDVWCGLEYEAACDMINEGLLREGLTMVRAVNDRYDGIKRNPWNEIEGSDHYARSMQSWNILLSLSGFEYDGPAGKMSFSPRLSPGQFKCFFSAAEGWGSISQSVKNNLQREIIELKWGQLRLNKMDFSPTGMSAISAVEVKLDGQPVPAKQTLTNGKIIISLSQEQILRAGQRLDVAFR